jgi:hypothetical protein
MLLLTLETQKPRGRTGEGEGTHGSVCQYINTPSLISILDYSFSCRYHKRILKEEGSKAATAFLERSREASRKHRQKYSLGSARFYQPLISSHYTGMRPLWHITSASSVWSASVIIYHLTPFDIFS